MAYLLDHLGDHKGTLLIEDLGKDLQARQNLIHLPVGGQHVSVRGGAGMSSVGSYN